MDDLKNFRQLGSRTPGHPEVETPGVEIGTGPLGQGVSNAVGMAIAEANLAATFNKEGFPIFDNYIYALCGDGCLEEGISHEAASLAGHLKLGRLIILYDDNHITIDGRTDITFTEDTLKRYEAYGWDVSRVEDGNHDVSGIISAVEHAKSVTDKPSLIAIRTTIGYGSALQDTSSVHGSPLGWDKIDLFRAACGFPQGEYFAPAQDVVDFYRAAGARGEATEAAWSAMLEKYRAAFPAEAAELARRMAGALKGDVLAALPEMGGKDVATRSASGVVLNALAKEYAEIVGGSADLTPSNNTALKCSCDFTPEHPEGRYIRFGVREHAMAAICNGLAAYGGFLPFCATFFVFIGYCLGAVRISALNRLRVLYIMTHDSIGVGEDGPTHQPVEQVPGLRLMPGLDVWRPCDTVETAVAWQCALENAHRPTCLSLSRQNLPFVSRDGTQVQAIARGGYVLRDCDGTPELILMATGSEVGITLEAAEALTAEGRKVRVVSMPCCERFDAQDAAYRESVLPDAVRARVAVEAAAADYWRKYVGLDGAVLGMTTFGASGPGKALAEHFGFTAAHLADMARRLLG